MFSNELLNELADSMKNSDNFNYHVSKNESDKVPYKVVSYKLSYKYKAEPHLELELRNTNNFNTETLTFYIDNQLRKFLDTKGCK